MSGLAPFFSQLVFWTRNRLGPSLKKRFGPDKLAILSVKSRLAKLILIKAHREDHRRDPGETLFRSRSDAWIVRGRALAEKVVKECGWCNRQDKRTLNQQMEDLPPQKFDIPCLPFNNICIDSAGPYQVKAMNNSRSKLKVWPVLFCCLNKGLWLFMWQQGIVRINSSQRTTITALNEGNQNSCTVIGEEI